MRKARFLLIFSTILLLLFTLLLAGCSTEEPPASEPPFVIEQGEITVSDYWKNDPVAVNPRPERVEGTPLCFEEIAYVGADMRSVESSTKRSFVTDDLNGATELIRNYAAYKNVAGSGFDTVCEAVSHVDFSQFRLLLFLEY